MCCEKERVEERIICILAAGSKVRSLPSLISASGVNRKATCQISGPRYPTLFFTLCYFLFRRLGFSYFRNDSSWLLLDMGFSIHSIDSWNEVVFLFSFFEFARRSKVPHFHPRHIAKMWEGRERIDELLPSSSISIDFIVSDHHAARVVGRPRRVRRMLICAARLFYLEQVNEY